MSLNPKGGEKPRLRLNEQDYYQMSVRPLGQKRHDLTMTPTQQQL